MNKKKHIGKNREENLNWLVDQWLIDGPPVCFLEGFPGVGKNTLAEEFCAAVRKQGHFQAAVIDEIADRATPSVLESLMDLAMKLSHQSLPEMEQVLFARGSPDIAYALEKALARPVLIVLDESQRFFKANSGEPLAEWKNALQYLRNRPNLPGRLLLLSDRLVERARWSEGFPIRTLTKLEPEEALEVLNDRLEADASIEPIDDDRKQDLLRALDYNPRAIESLVGALAFDTLDEIIGSNPGLWDVKDREVSREFLDKLEHDLLERTLAHLEPLHREGLRCLAVHRKGFKKQALELGCGGKEQAALSSHAK